MVKFISIQGTLIDVCHLCDTQASPLTCQKLSCSSLTHFCPTFPELPVKSQWKPVKERQRLRCWLGAGPRWKESTWLAGVHCGWQGNQGWGRVLNRSSLKVRLADMRHQSRLRSFCLIIPVPHTFTQLPVQNQISEHARFLKRERHRPNHFPCLLWRTPNVAQSSNIRADFGTIQFQLMLFAFGVPPESLENPSTVNSGFCASSSLSWCCGYILIHQLSLL